MDSVQTSEERGAEKLMDDYLKSVGLHRKKIAKDGSCLFRAVAEQVLHCQSLHTTVRAKCVEFLKQNRDSYEAFIEGDFEDYLCKLQDPQWVGEVEINALAVMYKRDFLIYQEPDKPAVHITDNNFVDKVQLCFLNGNHYDSVYPISHIKSTALCQSILYELLYEGVFKVDRSLLGVCQRNSRPSDLLSDDSMNACASSDESDLDTGEALWVENGTSTTSTRHNNQSHRGRGRGRQLPERVRRSLNPTLLRNVEYDVWHKTKRAQQKMDYCIAAGMHFTVGDRCQVRLESSGRSYNATIKEVPPSNGPVMVYIEELGRKQVPLWSLRPPSEESSWSVVVNRDKRLNGHGEWEERGKGRGRGKAVPASSSVSQATTPASSGRVQKQHSWPPQTTVEEQGGPKTSRKSMGSTEPAFGLTEEQRLAKEEEERNVALVEIQLRDEHSFPALRLQPGTQNEGGRRKVGEKKRSQRNKTKSPVEDVRVPSPSAEDMSKTSTLPLSATASTSAPNSDTTTPTNPTLPAALSANPDPSPARLGSIKASTANTNMATAASGSASSLPLTCATLTTKSNTQSYASAAAPPSSPPPAAAASAKPSVMDGAPPHSIPSSASLFSLTPPVLPAASSPPTPPALFSSSSSKFAASPPPSSSVPPPTFIAPIAPIAAQGFPRSSPPISSLPHSPSPPASFIHPAVQVHEVTPPPAPAQTTNSLAKTGGTMATSQTSQSQTSLSQIHPQVPQNQSQVSVSQVERQTQPEIQTQSQDPNQAMVPQMETDTLSSLSEPQSCTEGSSLPQTHLQFEVDQIQSSPPPPGASSPPVQPPHPSQVPHPSLSLSASPNAQNQTKTPPLPPQHPQPSQPPHPPHPSLHPQLQSPHPQSIPGAVPLQQMSQIYQDPLYPGFPQGEKGDMAPTPPISSSKSGDDLPQDVNIVRFFFNLGIKAYSMPIIPPYLYLLPLQQAHAMHPNLSSRSPSPHCLPSNPPTRHHEAYPPPQYPPTSATPQYDHQAPLAEPPRPSEPSFNQAGYPGVTLSPLHRMSSLPWQQMPPLRNPSYPVGYPSPPYQVPPSSSQGYHPSQGPGHPLYPPSLPLYPQASVGYQSTPEELQGVMERLQPTNGDTVSCHGHSQGPVESPAGADAANANNNRTVVVPSGFAHKKEPVENLPRTVLLVDPPLNNTPILALVPDPDVKDVPVSMATMKPSSSSPGSPSLYRGARKPVNPTKAYVPPGAPEFGQVGYLAAVTMAEPLSVGCSTEEDWEQGEGFKPTTLNLRGQRKSYRGGVRGRGGYRRRHGADMGVGLNYVKFSSSYRGRGREGGY